MERVVPLFVRRINDRAPVTVFGEDKLLDFTYVDDCTAGIHAGVQKLVGGAIANETINLGSGLGSTLLDLVHLIETNIGKEALVRTAPSRRGEVTRYVANISNARQKLGYEPKFTLADGIASYVRWCEATGWL